MNAQITSVTKRLKFMGNWWNKSLLARILVPMTLLTLLIIAATSMVNVNFLKETITDLMIKDTEQDAAHVSNLIERGGNMTPAELLESIALNKHSYALLIEGGEIAAVAGAADKTQLADYPQLKPLLESSTAGMFLDNQLEYGVSRQTGKYRIIVVSSLLDFSEGIGYYQLTLLVVAIASILVICGTVWLLVKRFMVKPIHEVAETLDRIGGGDLTQRLSMDVNRQDIWGMVARGVENMTSNLRNLVEQVVTTSDKVTVTSGDFVHSAQETSKASEQVTLSLQDISQGVDEEARMLRNIGGTMEDITMAIGEVEQVVKSMTSDFTSASELVSSGSVMVRDTVSQMNELAENVGSSSVVINELEHRSGKVGEIIQIITEIAGQTNLLALNAAIEAARAGEHGLGFAVVANEVRKLADQSNQAALEIQEIISLVQADTLHAVESMSKSTQLVESGMESVNQTGQVFEAIVKTIREVSSNVEMVDAIVQEVNLNAKEIWDRVQGIIQISEESSANVQSIAAATEEQNAIMEELALSSEELNRLSGNLREALTKFTV
ncbi:methyl-accepting chemotaxis protein [Paenibacillus thiaminolyticus]|nr:methyl-accepting chemotaxis protein [Paenibacillus thiaminolyticus]